MKAERKYKQQPVVVLTACETIANNCIENQAFLASKRPAWADPFFTNLKTEIQGLFPLIGVDNRKVTREATLALHLVIEPAIKDLKELKVQMDADIPKARREEIYNVLGFTLYYKSAVKGNQVDLINLLARFKTNITAELTNEITVIGIDAALITRISGYALSIQNANVTQETAKMAQPNLTAAVVEKINNVYTKTVNICKICKIFYKDDTEKRAMFSYSKTVAAIIGRQTEPDVETTTEVKTDTVTATTP